MRQFKAVGFAALLASSLAACAVSYEAENGDRVIIGLAYVRVGPSSDRELVAGNIIGVETVGVAAHHVHDNLTLAVGYHRHRAAALKDHSLVRGNVGAPLAFSSIKEPLNDRQTDYTANDLHRP